jgi:hypothetical protein
VTGDASIRAKNGEERGQLGRFAAQNRTKLTKFDHGFWIDLLIPQRLRGIFAFLAPQKISLFNFCPPEGGESQNQHFAHLRQV